MKLVSFEQPHGKSGRGQFLGHQSWGAVVGAGANAGVIDLGARFAPTSTAPASTTSASTTSAATTATPSLKSALLPEHLATLAKLVRDCKPDHALADLKLRKPVPDAEKIICVGVNYAERNDEYKDASDTPKFPSLFMRTPDSLVAHGENLLRPPESRQLDYEGEIVIVIGQGGRRIARENALQHIAGLTIMNEGTIRDWLRHGKFNVTQGKNFVASGSIGPWLVTSDEIADMTQMNLITRVNGEVRQSDNTSRMMFPFTELIRYISQFMLLKTGDIIATGTPTGAGARFEPPKWLVPGDVVEVQVEGIGLLSNTVADELVR